MNETTDKNRNTPLVLVVDDVRQTRIILRHLMQKEGYEVVEASNGIEGLEIYQRFQPDLILLDAIMPEMDGFTMCKELQSISKNHSPPVLMITAVEDEESVDKAFEAGATDYINKPFHLPLLKQRIRRLLKEKDASDKTIKALEKERETSEMRAKFVTMVSHEFRTPMTTILLSSELLEKYSYKWSDEKRQVHFERIKKAVQRMDNLLEDVLVMGKVQTGDLEFNPALFELEKLSLEIVEKFQSETGDKHHLYFLVNGEKKQVLMDEKLIGQILKNLLSNGIKYSPNGGNISLTLTYQENEVIIQVQDEGIGIYPEDMENIFQTFYRGQNIGNIPGTGLGLAIVKKAVDLHNGQVVADSQLGKGTTITVTLPTTVYG